MSTATATLARTTSAPATGIAARVFATENDLSQALLRITLAGVMFPHGAQKLLGWWGGYGFEGTMGFLTAQIGLPWIVAFLVIVAESVGALALAAGFLSRVAAAGLAAIMAGAIFTAHLGNGFFMNWNGNQAGEGFEYHLLAIGIALAVAIRGGGAWSVDRLLARRSQG
jgi:putative oxidoreductase